ncbi:MAG TPA: hypothetical protein VEJ86_14350, partial [Candidatus Binataceae bacterium]|nr:hypothetical protein [Candidatus Binataceae bacterium]
MSLEPQPALTHSPEPEARKLVTYSAAVRSSIADVRWQWAAACAGLVVVTALAILRLRDFPAQFTVAGVIGGVLPLLPQTGWAALKVWIFWGWTAAVIAALATRFDSGLDPC